jgi:hypothetical protein
MTFEQFDAMPTTPADIVERYRRGGRLFHGVELPDGASFRAAVLSVRRHGHYTHQ